MAIQAVFRQPPRARQSKAEEGDNNIQRHSDTSSTGGDVVSKYTSSETSISDRWARARWARARLTRSHKKKHDNKQQNNDDDDDSNNNNHHKQKAATNNKPSNKECLVEREAGSLPVARH